MSGSPLDTLGIGLWTLQSSTTRPGNPTAIYRRFADAAEHADALGFHSVWAAEHRLWYDGFCPQLLHAQAFAAARTTRL
ncbi:MAG TPA: LLM class flavin-dependent oxidoreductase, partial [Gaiella sp.]|nr:LLM class flavin-dependent oxidoreductase [Gaiella sp.]